MLSTRNDNSEICEFRTGQLSNSSFTIGPGLEAIGDYASSIGLFFDDDQALKNSYVPLVMLKLDQFHGRIDQIPQAKQAQKLLGREIQWRLEVDNFVVEAFVHKFAFAWNNVSKPVLSDILHAKPAKIEEIAKLESLNNALKLVISQLYPNQSEGWESIVREALIGNQRLIELEIEGARLEDKVLELEEKTAKLHTAQHGGKNYSRQLDWKWQAISELAAVMYFFAQHEAPDKKPRGKWGKGGTMLPYNQFLRKMAEGLADNWQKKSHLERLLPRPEHISQIGEQPLLLEIRNET